MLQWGGAAVIATAYYLLPLGLDRKPLFVVSMAMGAVAVIAGAVLRSNRASARVQMIVLVGIVLAFALGTVLGAETITGEIAYSMDEYFNVDDPTTILGVEFTPVAFKRDARPYYYLVLGFIVLTVVGMRRLQNSRLGRAWLYVREDQLAAEAMGIDTTQIKLIAIALGSAWAGVAGVLYASRFTVVAPESFNFLQSVIMFCIVVLGGSGSIPGVLVGTLGMVVLPELLRDVGPTFLYEGAGPFVILALLLGGYLFAGRARGQAAVVEAGLMAAAFFAPALALGEAPLYVIGLFMVLVAIIVLPMLRRRIANPLPWLAGALAIYTIVMLAVGSQLGPDVEREVTAFRIMDWRDGLMGVAMVLMMMLRPAGLIPERRRGIAPVTVEQPSEPIPTAARQQTTV